jgi:hypothetical protein
MAQTTGDYFVVASGGAVGSFTVDVAIVLPLRYGMTSITAPRTARRNRTFTVSAVLKPGYDGFTSPITFYVERKKGGRWRSYRTAGGRTPSVLVGAQTTFKASLQLPAGAFRVRARFLDAAHPRATYTGWKSVTVR